MSDTLDTLLQKGGLLKRLQDISKVIGKNKNSIGSSEIIGKKRRLSSDKERKLKADNLRTGQSAIDREAALIKAKERQIGQPIKLSVKEKSVKRQQAAIAKRQKKRASTSGKLRTKQEKLIKNTIAKRQAEPTRKAIKKNRARTIQEKMAAADAKRIERQRTFKSKSNAITIADRANLKARATRKKDVADIKQNVLLNTLKDRREDKLINSNRSRSEISLSAASDDYKINDGPHKRSKETVNDLTTTTDTVHRTVIDETNTRNTLANNISRERGTTTAHDNNRIASANLRDSSKVAGDRCANHAADDLSVMKSTDSDRNATKAERDARYAEISIETAEINSANNIAAKAHTKKNEMDTERIASAGTVDRRNTDAKYNNGARRAEGLSVSHYLDEVGSARDRMNIAEGKIIDASTAHSSHIRSMQEGADANAADVGARFRYTLSENDNKRSTSSAASSMRDNHETVIAAKNSEIETTTGTRNAALADETNSQIQHADAQSGVTLHAGELEALSATLPAVRAPRDAAFTRSELFRPTTDPNVARAKARKRQIEENDIPTMTNDAINAKSKNEQLNRILDEPGGIKEQKGAIDEQLKIAVDERKPLAQKADDLSFRKAEASKLNDTTRSSKDSAVSNLRKDTDTFMSDAPHLDDVNNMIAAKGGTAATGYIDINPSTEDIYVSAKRASSSDAGSEATLGVASSTRKAKLTENSISDQTTGIANTIADHDNLINQRDSITSRLQNETANTDVHNTQRMNESARRRELSNNADTAASAAGGAASQRDGVSRNIDETTAQRDLLSGKISDETGRIETNRKTARDTGTMAEELRNRKAAEAVAVESDKRLASSADSGRKAAAEGDGIYTSELNSATAREKAAKDKLAKAKSDTDALIESMNNDIDGSVDKYGNTLKKGKKDLDKQAADAGTATDARKAAQNKQKENSDALMAGREKQIEAIAGEQAAKAAHDKDLKTIRDSGPELDSLNSDVSRLAADRDAASLKKDNAVPTHDPSDPLNKAAKKANDDRIKAEKDKVNAAKSNRDDLTMKHDDLLAKKNRTDVELTDSIAKRETIAAEQKKRNDRLKDSDIELERAKDLKKQADDDIQTQKKDTYGTLRTGDFVNNLITLMLVGGLSAQLFKANQDALIPLFLSDGLVRASGASSIFTMLGKSEASGAVPGQVLTGNTDYDTGFSQGSKDGIEEGIRDGTNDGIVAIKSDATISDPSIEVLQTDRIASMKGKSITNIQAQLEMSASDAYCKEVQLQSVGMNIDMNKTYPQCKAYFAANPIDLCGETIYQYGYSYGEYGYGNAEAVQYGGEFVNPTEDYDSGYTAGYQSTYSINYQKAFLITKLQAISASIEGTTFSGVSSKGASGALRPMHKRIVKIMRQGDNDYGYGYGDYGYGDYGDGYDYGPEENSQAGGAVASLKRGKTFRQHQRLLRKIAGKTNVERSS